MIELGTNLRNLDHGSLSFAAMNGNLTIVKLILNAGVDQETVSMAFTDAAAYGQLEVVKFLLEVANPKADIHYEGDVALLYASQNGHLNVVRYLLEDARPIADISADYGGLLALRSAAGRGHLDVVRYLLEDARPRANIADDNFEVLKHAALEGQLRIVRYLLYDANPKAELVDSDALLFAAAQNGYESLVYELIRAGAQIKDTLMTVAIEYGQVKMVKFLLDRHVELTNENIRRAIEQGNDEIIALVLETRVFFDNFFSDGILSTDVPIIRKLLENTKISRKTTNKLELRKLVADSDHYLQKQFHKLTREYGPNSFGQQLKLTKYVDKNRIEGVRVFTEMGATSQIAFERACKYDKNGQIVKLFLYADHGEEYLAANDFSILEDSLSLSRSIDDGNLNNLISRRLFRENINTVRILLDYIIKNIHNPTQLEVVLKIVMQKQKWKICEDKILGLIQTNPFLLSKITDRKLFSTARIFLLEDEKRAVLETADVMRQMGFEMGFDPLKRNMENWAPNIVLGNMVARETNRYIDEEWENLQDFRPTL